MRVQPPCRPAERCLSVVRLTGRPRYPSCWHTMGDGRGGSTTLEVIVRSGWSGRLDFHACRIDQQEADEHVQADAAAAERQSYQQEADADADIAHDEAGVPVRHEIREYRACDVTAVER